MGFTWTYNFKLTFRWNNSSSRWLPRSKNRRPDLRAAEGWDHSCGCQEGPRGCYARAGGFGVGEEELGGFGGVT